MSTLWQDKSIDLLTVVVERNGVRDAIRSRGEVREVTRLSTGHVVLVVRGGELRPELEEGNQGEDLPLGRLRNSVPEGGRVRLRGERSSVHLHGPRELDSVGVHDVSDESKHGNASMPIQMK